MSFMPLRGREARLSGARIATLYLDAL